VFENDIEGSSGYANSQIFVKDRFKNPIHENGPFRHSPCQNPESSYSPSSDEARIKDI
jgi:hypothetical protein